MKISTKGIYAVRFMIFLSQRGGDTPVPLKEVADATKISRKYLEQIVSVLATAQLVRSSRGASGGYRLSKSPSLITMYDILAVTEGSLAPVDYLDELSDEPSPGEARYEIFVWRELHKRIVEYLKSVSLQDIIDQSVQLDIDNYSI